MIIEGLAAAVVIKRFYETNKSLKIDEQALKKYAKAFEQSSEAELRVRKKAEYTDKRLANVAKKKKSILERTIPRFVEVYGKIQQIELEGATHTDLPEVMNIAQKKQVLQSLSISVKQQFSKKELVCGYIVKGFGKLMILDSEKYLSAARSQMRASNVMCSQASSIAEFYDAIIGRADRIARLLSMMNQLFIGAIDETEKVINKNGLGVRNYSEYEKGVLMTCANMAVAMTEVINIPVVDEEGALCESAIEMIQTGEQYIESINQLIQA